MSSESKYEDIINLPHHVSPRRKRMAMIDRAAQFSPFAALTGHGAAISETARLTVDKAELDECEKSIVNEKLNMLLNLQELQPRISIFYFRPDNRKQGGAYLTAEGRIERIDAETGEIIMADGTAIPVNDVRDIQGELFSRLFAE